MSILPDYSLHFFDCAKVAREYRHANGTGGWIFVDAVEGRAILFPPQMAPSQIFIHPATRGRGGRLIGAA